MHIHAQSTVIKIYWLRKDGCRCALSLRIDLLLDISCLPFSFFYELNENTISIVNNIISVILSIIIVRTVLDFF